MEWINLMKNKGHFVRECLVPAVYHNRIKYNRMNGEEQKIYDKRCSETKIEYRLYITDTSNYQITKQNTIILIHYKPERKTILKNFNTYLQWKTQYLIINNKMPPANYLPILKRRN